MRNCKICGVEKEDLEFNLNYRKTGFKPVCKTCANFRNREYKRRYSNEKKTEYKIKEKEYRIKNKEKIQKYMINYRIEKKEKLKEQSKAYYKEHKYLIKEKAKSYRKNNLNKVKDYGYFYYRNNKEVRRDQKRLKDRDYREKNGNKLKEKKKEYYKKNKGLLKLKSKKYREENKDIIKEQRRRSREKNKINLILQKKMYYLKYKKDIIRKSIEGRKRLLKKNPSFRALDSCRKRIGHVFRSLNKCNGNKIIKMARTYELLGCSKSELISWIENKFKPGMSWENYGLYGWHIDHIIPCIFFKDFTKIETQKACFNYKNLQPLWADENLSKGSKLI